MYEETANTLGMILRGTEYIQVSGTGGPALEVFSAFQNQCSENKSLYLAVKQHRYFFVVAKLFLCVAKMTVLCLQSCSDY